MRQLAGDGEFRSSQEQLAELAASVADLSKRVAAREREPKLQVWNWLDAPEDQRAGWIKEVKGWYHRVEELEPRLAHQFLPCWEFHREVYWLVIQLYLQHQKAFPQKTLDSEGEEHENKQGDADMGGWWFLKWFPQYRTAAQTLKASCSAACIEHRQKLAARQIVIPDDLSVDLPERTPDLTIDPDPESSPRNRDDFGGREGGFSL
jgi:hypothetical protein